MAESVGSAVKELQGFEENVNGAERDIGKKQGSKNDADSDGYVEWCYENQEIFQRPMCLICTTKEGKFSAEVEVLKQIEKIDAPLVVVAIAGPYRTGKSYLMNRLAGHSKGFPLGNTIDAKTKGIWAWCRKHPKHKNTVLLLLDTEGLGDCLKEDGGHDNKLFTLAVLLCNVLVYNIMKVPNKGDIEKLAFISTISETISFKNKTGEYDEGIDRIMPTFVLCVRDFTLDLEHEGKPITADQYLDILLKPGSDKNNQKYKRLRECVIKLFPDRKCFVFDSPGNRDVLKKLEELPIEKLNEIFVKETSHFLEYIYTLGSKRILHSKHVTGTMFAPLVETYVGAIREGNVFNVDDAFEKVANIENTRLVKIVVDEFSTSLKEIELPVKKMIEFDRLGQMKQKNALTRFRMEAVFNPEKFEKKAQKEMDKPLEDLRAKNLEKVKKQCEKALEEQYEKIKTKRSTGDYYKENGYAEYKRDIEDFTVTYRERLKDTDEHISQNVLNTFLVKETGEDIVMANTKLNEQQKNSEIEKFKIEREHERQKHKKMHEDHIKAEMDLKEKFESELKIERETHEKILQMTKKQNDELVAKNREIAAKHLTEKNKREKVEENLRKTEDRNIFQRIFNTKAYDD